MRIYKDTWFLRVQERQNKNIRVYLRSSVDTLIVFSV